MLPREEPIKGIIIPCQDNPERNLHRIRDYDSVRQAFAGRIEYTIPVICSPINKSCLTTLGFCLLRSLLEP